MFSYKLWTSLTAALLLTGGIFFSQAGVYQNRNDYEHLKAVTTNLEDQAIEAGADLQKLNHSGTKTSYQDKTITVDETFTTNLPLIVIDTDGNRPDELHAYDKEQGKFVNLEGVTKYVYGSIQLINNDSGINSISDSPEKSSKMRIRKRGNSSMLYDKHQYLVKLIHEDETKNKMNLLGMGKESDWILSVSMMDKSLMRNKLAYETAKKIYPFTSDSRYCEVVWKDADQYSYEGVYMLVEPVEVSDNRVQVAEQRANLPFVPALFRRDRLDQEGLFLNNTASKDGTYYGAIEVMYPPVEQLSDSAIQQLNDQIEEFEQALLSDDPDVYFTYRDMINIESFLDYYLLNEFFGNYDAGNNSTYFYIDQNGKITMGPVWDFDGAMDNWDEQEAEPNTTVMETAPWFGELIRDKEFVRLLSERFKVLRNTVLSDESIARELSSYKAELGPSLDRDWARYSYFYKSNFLKKKANTSLDRNTYNYESEIERIQDYLKKHGDWMTENLETLNWKSDESLDRPYENNTWASMVKMDLLPILFVGIFLISIVLIQRG